MKNLLLPLIFSLILSESSAQGIAIQILPEQQTITAGQDANYNITVSDSGGFEQQVFFEVVTHNFNSSDVSFSFSPNTIGPPYSQEVIFTASTNGSIDHGEYMMVIEAGNGPVLSYDTCYLEVGLDSCFWFEHENIGEKIRGISIDDNNNVWVSDINIGLIKYNGSSWISYNPPNGHVTGSVAFDSENNTWVPTDNGLAKFDGENWTFFNISTSQIPTNSLNSVTIDADDVIWIGTNDGGIVKYDGVFWTVYDESNSNLLSNNVSRIQLNSQGVLWFRTNDSNGYTGIGKFDGVDVTLYTRENSCMLEGNWILSISIDNDDAIWISSMIGVIKFDEVQWEQWLVLDEDNNHIIRDLDCNVISQDNQSGLTFPASQYIFTDRDNNKWISSIQDGIEPEGELIRFDDYNWEIFNRENSTIPDENTMYMAQNDSSDLWFVTLQNTLCCDFSVSFYTCDSLVVTSINNQQVSSPKFHIYPNPVREKVYIDFKNQTNAGYSIEIISLNGRIIFRKIVKNIQNKSIEEIDLSQVPSGIYLIKISNKDYSQVKKLVIR
jgi:ligand-binding sensor domain-containing protein